MGRPPCCDKVGIKKGPWTPEEDIVLVSYIQENGPGNWRVVPTNTGLLRCSKSCRLRWTNYLRPGIRRGNFSPHEEGMIIHLQALLGNKWAAIATYLPNRTDNDIKNYWNTHLKKKLKKLQSGNLEPQMGADSAATYHQFITKAYGERAAVIDDNNNKQNPSSVYASSAENISRLLEGWMRSSSSPPNPGPISNLNDSRNKFDRDFGKILDHSASSLGYRTDQIANEGNHGMAKDELDCILSFDHHNLNDGGGGVLACDKSSCDSSQKGSEEHETGRFELEIKPKMECNNPPLSFLEKWLLDESAAQGEGVMELPSIF